jgi:hypothetical protein
LYHRIPNIPGFYLLFRGYSHFRALYGARHLEYLISNNLISLQPSKILDQVYAAGLRSQNCPVDPKSLTVEDVREIASDLSLPLPQEDGAKEQIEDVMLLNSKSGQLIAREFGVPEMAVEVERAVEQLEKKFKMEAAEAKKE